MRKFKAIFPFVTIKFIYTVYLTVCFKGIRMIILDELINPLEEFAYFYYYSIVHIIIIILNCTIKPLIITIYVYILLVFRILEKNEEARIKYIFFKKNTHIIIITY